jgi:hypothetical protein
MNACVPMLKIVLLCNALCRDFSNRRKMEDQTGRRTAQEMVTDERRSVRKVEMVDDAREVEDVDDVDGMWNCGLRMLEELHGGWLMVAGVLDAELHHQAIAACRKYNANLDDTKPCALDFYS